MPYELPVVNRQIINKKIPTKKGASQPAPEPKKTPKNIKLAPIKHKNKNSKQQQVTKGSVESSRKSKMKPIKQKAQDYFGEYQPAIPTHSFLYPVPEYQFISGNHHSPGFFR